jgi:hypothetical protein
MCKYRLASDLIVKGIKNSELMTKPNSVLEILISNDLDKIKKTVEMAFMNSFEINNIAEKCQDTSPEHT